MARYEFRLPDIGEGVAEGEIVGWLIEKGQRIEHDQPMVEVMTDKATVLIGAPTSGTVLEIGAAVGDTVSVGHVLVVLEVDASAAGVNLNGGAGSASKYVDGRSVDGRSMDGRSVGGAEDGTKAVASACGDIRDDLPGVAWLRGTSATSDPGGHFNAKPLATPATRKMARELGVDLRRVQATGSHGRVTGDDVRNAHARSTSGASEPASAVSEPTGNLSGARPPDACVEHAEGRAHLAAPVVSAGPEERVPLRGVRRRIFESMTQSTRTVAHCTFVEECDVTALKLARERLKERAARTGVRLSFLPFIAKATVAALKKSPSLNATFDEATEEIVRRRYYNIGIATATDTGLTVPVVKSVDKLSLLDVARQIESLAELARAQRLGVEQLQGGTFTISSLGAMGGLLATPVVRFPEVAILGVHQMKRKPVVRDGQIVIGDVMLLSLSFDHRLVDGQEAAGFMYQIIDYLETPESMLLEMT